MTNTATHNTITGPKYGDARSMPWNVMGKELSGNAWTDVNQAMAESGLDFTVRMIPMTGYDKADNEPMAFAEFIDAPKSRGVVRPWGDGQAIVGVTGTRFTPIQNRDAFSVATPLVEEYGATIAGMADFRHGGASLMVLNLNRAIELERPDGGVDVMELDLLVKNSHDGSSALTFALTEMRLACTNALPMAVSGAQRLWKISHTPNAQERMDLAKKAILKAVGYQEKVQVVAQAMMNQEMVDAEFAKMVATLFPVDAEATGKVADRKREVQSDLLGLYRTSPTLDGIRGTRWGGYNALTEYLDHYRPVRASNEGVARAEGQLEGPNVRAKDRVFKMFAADLVPA